jgi:hypothetical protein
MTERVPPSRSTNAGRRGRHKHRGSPETRRFDHEHLVPPRPPWMDEAVYRALVEVRERLG